MKQKGTSWTDAEGNVVPKKHIKRVLVREEYHSQKILKQALLVEKELAKLATLATDGYKDIYNEKMKTIVGEDDEIHTNYQSMTFTAFDDSAVVKITKPKVFSFDNTYTEEIKKLFKEYFDSLSGESETAMFMKELVNGLLYTSGGNVDYSKVLLLRSQKAELMKSERMAKKAEKFIEAVDLFDQAVRKKSGKTGLYITVKDENGKERRVHTKHSDFL